MGILKIGGVNFANILLKVFSAVQRVFSLKTDKGTSIFRQKCWHIHDMQSIEIGFVQRQ